MVDGAICGGRHQLAGAAHVGLHPGHFPGAVHGNPHQTAMVRRRQSPSGALVKMYLYIFKLFIYREDVCGVFGVVIGRCEVEGKGAK